MGSPLAPVLANLFMGHHEQHWLIQKETLSVLFYKRYVDDIFYIFKTSEQADKFLDFSNTRHNIKFTIEKEQDQKLPFLDVLITKASNNRITTNYKKSTHTGQEDYLSFIPTRYKLGLVKTFVDRLYKINNTWSGFHNDMEKTKSILQKNLFPPDLIDKVPSCFNNFFHRSDCVFFLFFIVILFVLKTYFDMSVRGKTKPLKFGPEFRFRMLQLGDMDFCILNFANLSVKVLSED